MPHNNPVNFVNIVYFDNNIYHGHFLAADDWLAGMAKLGGHAAFMGPEDVHIGVNESVKDTARYITFFFFFNLIWGWFSLRSNFTPINYFFYKI